MRKQNIILVFVLLLIIISVYFGLFKNNSELTEFDLQLQDTSQITSFVVETKGVEINIEKKAGDWMVNEIYHGNNELIRRVLRVFKNLNISIIAKKDSTEVYIQHLKKKGTKLQFFNNEEKITSFWIGDFNTSKNATLLMNEREQPVFVTAPGLSSNIAKFVVPDDIFWRDKRLFDLEPVDIKMIRLQDYGKPDVSFKLTIDGNDYLLVNNKNSNVNFDDEKVSRYLSYFRGVRFESLEENFSTSGLDSIINQKPLYEITIQSTGFKDLNIKLLPKADTLQKNEVDLNYVYGIVNNQRPVVIINYFSIDPLLKEISYFKPEIN